MTVQKKFSPPPEIKQILINKWTYIDCEQKKRFDLL